MYSQTCNFFLQSRDSSSSSSKTNFRNYELQSIYSHIELLNVSDSTADFALSPETKKSTTPGKGLHGSSAADFHEAKRKASQLGAIGLSEAFGSSTYSNWLNNELTQFRSCKLVSQQTSFVAGNTTLEKNDTKNASSIPSLRDPEFSVEGRNYSCASTYPLFDYVPAGRLFVTGPQIPQAAKACESGAACAVRVDGFVPRTLAGRRTVEDGVSKTDDTTLEDKTLSPSPELFYELLSKAKRDLGLPPLPASTPSRSNPTPTLWIGKFPKALLHPDPAADQPRKSNPASADGGQKNSSSHFVVTTHPRLRAANGTTLLPRATFPVRWNGTHNTSTLEPVLIFEEHNVTIQDADAFGTYEQPYGSSNSELTFSSLAKTLFRYDKVHEVAFESRRGSYAEGGDLMQSALNAKGGGASKERLAQLPMRRDDIVIWDALPNLPAGQYDIYAETYASFIPANYSDPWNWTKNRNLPEEAATSVQFRQGLATAENGSFSAPAPTFPTGVHFWKVGELNLYGPLVGQQYECEISLPCDIAVKGYWSESLGLGKIRIKKQLNVSNVVSHTLLSPDSSSELFGLSTVTFRATPLLLDAGPEHLIEWCGSENCVPLGSLYAKGVFFGSGSASFTACGGEGIDSIERPEGTWRCLKKKAFLYVGSDAEPEKRRNWTYAQEYCRELGGDLATLESDQDGHLIYEMAPKGHSANAWVGLHRISEEEFTDWRFIEDPEKMRVIVGDWDWYKDTKTMPFYAWYVVTDPLNEKQTPSQPNNCYYQDKNVYTAIYDHDGQEVTPPCEKEFCGAYWVTKDNCGLEKEDDVASIRQHTCGFKKGRWQDSPCRLKSDFVCQRRVDAVVGPDLLGKTGEASPEEAKKIVAEGVTLSSLRSSSTEMLEVDVLIDYRASAGSRLLILDAETDMIMGVSRKIKSGLIDYQLSVLQNVSLTSGLRMWGSAAVYSRDNPPAASDYGKLRATFSFTNRLTLNGGLYAIAFCGYGCEFLTAYTRDRKLSQRSASYDRLYGPKNYSTTTMGVPNTAFKFSSLRLLAASDWKEQGLRCVMGESCVLHNKDFWHPAHKAKVPVLSGFATVLKRCVENMTILHPGFPVADYREEFLDFGILRNTTKADYYSLCWSATPLDYYQTHRFLVEFGRLEIVDRRQPQGRPI